MNANPYSPPDSDVSNAGTSGYADVKVFTTEGRLGRMRFFVYNTSVSLLIIPAMIPMMMATRDMGGASGVGMALFFILYIFAFVMSVIFAVRRFHDVDLSGWFYLVMFIPIVSFFMALYLLFAPGTPASNRFGLQPIPNSQGVKVIFWVLIGLIVLSVVAFIAVNMNR